MNSSAKKSRGRFHKLVRESFFINIIIAIAEFFMRGFDKSLFARIFTNYGRVEELYDESLTGNTLKKVFSVSKKKRNFKSAAAEACENSYFLRTLRTRTLELFEKPLRYYGSGLVYFGLYVMILHIIKYLAIIEASFDISYIFTGLLCFISGICFMTSKKNAATAITESKLLGFVLFTMLGLDKRMLLKCEQKTSSHASAIAAGTILGLLSVVIHPLLLLAGVVGLIGAALILYSPETGMLLIFFTLPFLPTMALAGLTVLTAFSYFYKVLRGKRVFKLEFFDILVLCFAVIVLFSGLISMGGSGSLPPSLMYVCFLGAYFLAINLMKSEELLSKCVNRMVIASVGVAIYGIYQNFFGTTTAAWLDSEMFNEIGNRVVSTFENPNVLGQYLILLLPFTIIMTLGGKGRDKRMGGFIATVLLGICLIFTWSRGAWLGAVFGIVIMLLLYSKLTMRFCVAGLFAIPFLPFIIPDTILNRFTSIGNLGDSSTMYRVNIWKGTLSLIEHYFVGGIGMGEAAFRKIYPQYSLEAIEKAPHSHNLLLQVQTESGIFGMIFLVLLLFFFIKLCADFVTEKYKYEGISQNICLAGFGGMLAVLLQSFTDYTWYNYRFFLLFWLVIAICVSARRNKLAEISAAEMLES